MDALSYRDTARLGSSTRPVRNCCVTSGVAPEEARLCHPARLVSSRGFKFERHDAFTRPGRTQCPFWDVQFCRSVLDA